MTDNITNAALRSIIQSLMAMPDNSVRPAHQNAPIKPGEEYITVLIASENAEGTDETYWQDPTAEDPLFGYEYISGVRLVVATIQYWNGDAYGRLRTLSQRLQSAIGIQALEDANLGFVSCVVNDIAGLLSDLEWQPRAAMRFEFYAAIEDVMRTPVIVRLPLSMYSEDGQIRENEVTINGSAS